MKKRQNIDLDACHYEKNSISQFLNAMALIRQVPVTETDSLLDVGCGIGDIIAELSRKAPLGKSIGVDPSSNMIQLASKKFPKEFYPNLEFRVMTAEEMQLPVLAFDHIICTNALQWIREPRKAIQLMFNCLKYGGNLVVLTYLKNTPYTRVFERVTQKYYPHLIDQLATKTMLSELEYKQTLIDVGFSLNVFSVSEVLFRYKNTTKLTEYVKGWLPCLLPITSNEQNEFIDKMILEISDLGIYRPGKEILIPHKVLHVIATKD